MTKYQSCWRDGRFIDPFLDAAVTEKSGLPAHKRPDPGKVAESIHKFVSPRTVLDHKFITPLGQSIHGGLMGDEVDKFTLLGVHFFPGGDECLGCLIVAVADGGRKDE